MTSQRLRSALRSERIAGMTSGQFAREIMISDQEISDLERERDLLLENAKDFNRYGWKQMSYFEDRAKEITDKIERKKI